ncbi:MAG: hypothetical protein P1P86_13810 [Bacteroidales bacterium]|nr:hypothetical protein [Bacteroidales bacterium]
MIKIIHAVQSFDPCRMLVFGLGNDSPFWCEINKHGRTVFLEDFKPWFQNITGRYPEIEAYAVSYPCNITQWKELLDQAHRLTIDLPDTVAGSSWDVILVDGPRGHKYSEEIPGRMSSIYMASRLAGKSSYVFVHDAQRTVEKVYAQRYLGQDRLIEQVSGRALLLVYRF